MPLGEPRTEKFSIGTAEIRLGPLSAANLLTSSHSIGVVDTASMTVEATSVELKAMFPQVTVASAIVAQPATITATLREYSRRNLRIALGAGLIGAEPADFATTLAAAPSASDEEITVGTGAGASIPAGSFLTIYKAGAPEYVSIVRVASVAADVVTLDPGTPLTLDFAIGDLVFLTLPIPVGALTQTNYMSLMFVQRENVSGRPTIGSFWKVSVSSGLNQATNVTDFASTDLTFQCLQPVVTDYAVGGPLEHLANIIPGNPVGLIGQGGDA